MQSVVYRQLAISFPSNKVRENIKLFFLSSHMCFAGQMSCFDFPPPPNSVQVYRNTENPAITVPRVGCFLVVMGFDVVGFLLFSSPPLAAVSSISTQNTRFSPRTTKLPVASWRGFRYAQRKSADVVNSRSSLCVDIALLSACSSVLLGNTFL